MSRYEQVLRHIRYRNWHPAALEARRFRLKCSELNGRYTSNEFNLEVSEPRSCEGSPGPPIHSLRLFGRTAATGPPATPGPLHPSLLFSGQRPP